MKRNIFRILRVLGIDTLFRFFFRRHVLVLMYHGVLSDHDANGDGDWLQVRASEFEDQMRYLSRHYEVTDFANALSPKKTSRPLAIVTFDDGYANNCSVALPILKKFSLPATIFVTTGFVDTPRQFWWDRLRSGLGAGKSPSKKDEDKLKSLHPCSIDAAVDSILDSSKGTRSPFPVESYRALNRREIGELLESGLIELGSHTHQHEILLGLSDEEVHSTLKLSSEALREWGTTGRWFAAPNGDFRIDQLKLVQAAGYEICVGTRPTGLWKAPLDRFSIPRIGIGRGLSIDEFAMATSGAIAWAKSLRTQPTHKSS